jgi:cytochrome b561
MIGIPLTGWAIQSACRVPIAYWKGSEPLAMPQHTVWSCEWFFSLHGMLSYAFLLLIGVHIAAGSSGGMGYSRAS